jgi:hypothetical protein
MLVKYGGEPHPGRSCNRIKKTSPLSRPDSWSRDTQGIRDSRLQVQDRLAGGIVDDIERRKYLTVASSGRCGRRERKGMDLRGVAIRQIRIGVEA